MNATATRRAIPTHTRVTLTRQMRKLRTRYPDAIVLDPATPRAIATVRIPAMRLDAKAWNMPHATIEFDVLHGFPYVPPEGFRVREAIRSAAGSYADYTWPRPDGGVRFGWGVRAWNPLRDTLLTYVYVIRQRLAMGPHRSHGDDA
jgi:hypothetical protein